MLKNYLKIAFRNLVKHKVFSFINITGLTVGIACCLLLLLYIKDETGYDQHHLHAKDLYRVTTIFHNADGSEPHIPTSSPPIVMTMRSEFPEVINATRIVSPPGVDQFLIKYKENTFFEDKGLIVDSTFFQIFAYQFAAGNPEKALVQPNSVVLTQELAYKIFGKLDVLEEIININTNDYKVTGIVQNPDKKSHIEANFFTSMESEGLGEFVARETNWAGQNFVYSYIQLNSASSPEALEAKLPAFLDKYGAASLKARGMDKSLVLQRVTDIHLKSHFNRELSQNGSIVYIYVLSAIAVFMLLIACINFMNLSTAKAMQRASEVGVRKTLGATQTLLIRQFLSEAMLIVFVAVLMSLILVEILLPFFNNLTGKNIGFSAISWPYYVVAAVTLTVVTSLLAGGYPAFFLSSFQPAKVLKGKVTTQLSSGILRKVLVVFQFVIAICLISGVIIILSQLNYMREQELGFEATSRVVIPLRTEDATQDIHSLKNKLSQQAEIRQVTATSIVPGRNINHDFSLYPAGSNMERAMYCQRYFVDENYFDVMGLKIQQGRSFEHIPEVEHDGRIVVTQMALKHFNIPPNEAIGTKMYTDWQGTTYEFEIIGVVNDFHQVSLHAPISPVIFHPGDAGVYNFAVAAVRPENMKLALTDMEQAWKEINPELPFEYTLLDQNIQNQYESDAKMSQVIGSFTLIAILISCLGLYGLSAFVAERKVKEIGIRKVLGAQVFGIVSLLSRDFTKLVLIAFVISVPLSYYIMDQWLQNFAYRIDIGPKFFVIAGLLALVIAWCTVSYHAIRAALANPVKSLRSE